MVTQKPLLGKKGTYVGFNSQDICKRQQAAVVKFYPHNSYFIIFESVPLHFSIKSIVSPMRTLQTDEQWAAVVILPSELLIFHIGSIFFESISLHVSTKSGSPCCMYITDKQTNNDETKHPLLLLS